MVTKKELLARIEALEARLVPQFPYMVGSPLTLDQTSALRCPSCGHSGRMGETHVCYGPTIVPQGIGIAPDWYQGIWG